LNNQKIYRQASKIINECISNIKMRASILMKYFDDEYFLSNENEFGSKKCQAFFNNLKCFDKNIFFVSNKSN
jgi:predicted transcriptional regulator